MNFFSTTDEYSFISVVFQNVKGPCVLNISKEEKEYKPLA